jgi:cytochrome P450
LLVRAPGPASIPFFGIPLELWCDPLTFLVDAARQYGAVVRLGPRAGYLVNHPDYIKHVLLDNYRNYPKDHNPAFDPLLGAGLLTSDGAFWRRQRRLAQPAFHHERIAAATAVVTSAATALLERWRAFAEQGRPFDVVPELMRLTLQIVGQALLGSNLSADVDVVSRAFMSVLEQITHPPLIALPAWLPISRKHALQQALHTLEQLVYRMIDERRTSRTDPGDLISLLLAAHDAETGEPLSDRQIRDEIMTVLFAGQETTATALAWTVALLAWYPAVEQRLQEELTQVLGGRVPTAQDLAQLTYTRMVIAEALRLYPPAWAFARIAQADDEIGGYHIPAGAVVTVSPYVIHRHPAFWEQPERFDPERFRPECSAGRPRFAYIPFGGGPRQCIGNAFALTEMLLILATVAQTYQLQIVSQRPVEPYPMVTLRPRHGIRVTLRKQVARQT